MKTELAIKKLREFFKLERRLPTYEEMTTLFGFSSKNATFYLINKLIEVGVLEKGDKGKLLPKGLFQIPLLGIIHAGYPVPADALSDNSIDLYQYILDLPGQIFSLIVKGDSMIEEGLMDGDIAIIEKSREARNGDIVAAFVDNEWTLKSFLRRDGEILLVPANPKYPVIRPKQHLQLGGVVISVIRKYH